MLQDPDADDNAIKTRTHARTALVHGYTGTPLRRLIAVYVPPVECCHIAVSPKGGTQLTYHLSTVDPAPLLKLEELVNCKGCDVSTIGLYMQGVLKVRFDRGGFEHATGHTVAGIGQDRLHLAGMKNTTEECAASFAAHKWMVAAGQAWPSGPDHFAPVMIKSHYPTIGTSLRWCDRYESTLVR